MQDRIRKLRSELYTAKGGDSYWVDRQTNEQKIFEKLHSLLGFLENPNKSELLSQEEYDAIVFFAAFVKYHYASSSYYYSSNGVRPSAELQQFLDRMTAGSTSEFCTYDNYVELIHWGLVLLKQNQTKEEKQSSGFLQVGSQPILGLATPQIFTDYPAYKKAQKEEQAKRYQSYVQARVLARERDVPVLQNNLKTYQWHRGWGTALSLIPGVFFFKEGLPGCWQLLKTGQGKAAIAWFFASLVLTALSPLGALLNNWTYVKQEEETQKALAKADASQDVVVTKVLTKQAYFLHRNNRKLFNNGYKAVVKENPTKLKGKPKKYVEEFKDSEGEKVRLYMDRAQAERFERYEQLFAKKGVFEGTELVAFFKSLKPSKVQSTAAADALFHQQEEAAKSQARI